MTLIAGEVGYQNIAPPLVKPSVLSVVGFTCYDELTPALLLRSEELISLLEYKKSYALNFESQVVKRSKKHKSTHHGSTLLLIF